MLLIKYYRADEEFVGRRKAFVKNSIDLISADVVLEI